MNRTEKPMGALKINDLLQDFALHHDIERRRRLVHDDQLGPERQADGNDDALAHAAAELVRIVVEPAGRDADQAKHLLGPRP